jgi:Acyl-CoA thioester hydrolase/BAAT N-terminal region
LRWLVVGGLAISLGLCAGCSCGSTATRHIELHAGPAAAAFDMPVHVTVSGLPPGERVTIQAQAHDGQGRPWESQAQFLASASNLM